MWHIHPDFEKYLEMENFESPEPEERPVIHKTKKNKSTADGGAPKGLSKRKIEETSASAAPATSPAPAVVVKEPKKLKRAFGFFVKDKRNEAEAKVQNPSVSHSQQLTTNLRINHNE